MSDGIWSALSGAVAHLAQLDVAANNVANAGTAGFRADHAVFREVLAQATAPSSNGAPQPPPARNLRYSRVDALAPDTTSAPTLSTGRNLDVAVRGDGWLSVQTDQGVRYTRAGALQVARDGTLVMHSGAPYLDGSGYPIRVPPDGTDTTVGPDGAVMVGGATVGRLKLVAFPDPTVLSREGALLHKLVDGSDPPAASTATLQAGALEMSNVSPVQSMIEIVSASRGFEACERAIDAFKQADERAAMKLMGAA